jgi:hypothetical protein
MSTIRSLAREQQKARDKFKYNRKLRGHHNHVGRKNLSLSQETSMMASVFRSLFGQAVRSAGAGK